MDNQEIVTEEYYKIIYCWTGVGVYPKEVAFGLANWLIDFVGLDPYSVYLE